jgi:16S rRNA processing protein RimM
MTESLFTTLGEVVKPHGLKGELRIDLHAESPSVFDAVKTLQLARPGDRPRTYVLSRWRMHQDRPLLTLEGVDDRDKAEAMRGCLVMARTADLPGLAEDEVYLHQLLGLAVLLPSGERLGVIEGFIDGVREVWSIRADDGREILFPAEPQFVLAVDPEAGLVRIDPPEGLLELYLSPE